MSAADRIKMTVFVNKDDAPKLEEAAAKAGYTHSKGGKSEWVRQLAVDAATAAADGAVSVSGPAARAIAADAAAEGITTKAWLERAVMLTRVAREGLAPRRRAAG